LTVFNGDIDEDEKKDITNRRDKCSFLGASKLGSENYGTNLIQNTTLENWMYLLHLFVDVLADITFQRSITKSAELQE